MRCLETNLLQLLRLSKSINMNPNYDVLYIPAAISYIGGGIS